MVRFYVYFKGKADTFTDRLMWDIEKSRMIPRSLSWVVRRMEVKQDED